MADRYGSWLVVYANRKHRVGSSFCYLGDFHLVLTLKPQTENFKRIHCSRLKGHVDKCFRYMSWTRFIASMSLQWFRVVACILVPDHLPGWIRLRNDRRLLQMFGKYVYVTFSQKQYVRTEGRFHYLLAQGCGSCLMLIWTWMIPTHYWHPTNFPYEQVGRHLRKNGHVKAKVVF